MKYYLACIVLKDVNKCADWDLPHPHSVFTDSTRLMYVGANLCCDYNYRAVTVLVKVEKVLLTFIFFKVSELILSKLFKVHEISIIV